PASPSGSNSCANSRSCACSNGSRWYLAQTNNAVRLRLCDFVFWYCLPLTQRRRDAKTQNSKVCQAVLQPESSTPAKKFCISALLPLRCLPSLPAFCLLFAACFPRLSRLPRFLPAFLVFGFA